jgi:hypothetical protein
MQTRELVARAPEVLEELDPAGTILRLRRRAWTVAEGLAASGTVPLIDLSGLAATPTSRYRPMLDDYQILAREQLICGAQVHVGIADRDVAVAGGRQLARAAFQRRLAPLGRSADRGRRNRPHTRHPRPVVGAGRQRAGALGHRVRHPEPPPDRTPSSPSCPNPPTCWRSTALAPST